MCRTQFSLCVAKGIRFILKSGDFCAEESSEWAPVAWRPFDSSAELRTSQSRPSNRAALYANPAIRPVPLRPHYLVAKNNVFVRKSSLLNEINGMPLLLNLVVNITRSYHNENKRPNGLERCTPAPPNAAEPFGEPWRTLAQNAQFPKRCSLIESKLSD